MMRQITKVLSTIAFLFLMVSPGLGQTGTISGDVVDGETGDPLPGVNIVVEGTQRGATTNADGQYTIINVSPGTYSVRASFVGYTPQVVENVEVNADLRTEVDFELQEEAVGLEEVTVQAEQPVVRPDVSANVANISVESVESAPVTSVGELIGLQAGVEGGLRIRGSGSDELSFQVDGLSMRNPRNNSPLTNIPFTSLEAVQVQTGGFNAEYGNLRSGLVNVSTREGARDRYSADVLYRYSPPSRKHLGPSPNDPTAYLMRPYVSPPSEYPNADLLAEEDVAYLGTHSDESPWDEYKRRQYPQFEGWRSVAERWAEDESQPDLTPEQLKEVFMWTHRKEFPKVDEYLVDASFGGPVPVVSEALGDLRFFVSYRGDKDAFIVPQLRNADRDQTIQGTVTSNLAQGMKLNLLGLHSVSRDQYNSYPSGGDGSEDGIFARQEGSLVNVYDTRYGGTFTHTVGPNTFYTVSVQRNASEYEIGPGRARNFETVKTIGGLELDEAPFGFYNPDQIYDPSGMELGGRWSVNRDSTEVQQYTVSADITSQLAPYSQFKTGIEFYHTDYNSKHGIYNPAQPSVSNPKYFWHRKASQGGAYVQNKFEFEGMIANVGFRADYFQPLGEWYSYDLYHPGFASNTLREDVETEPIEGRLSVSPRLGVSFPITVNSKLYFNYGHFRNTQELDELFDIRTVFNETAIDLIGNPNFPMSKTVAYELGYDQNILEQFLLRISGYYKAQSNQPRNVTFTGLTGRVNYNIPLPLNYGDVRGLEFTFERRRGQWVRGFVNYTYMVEKSGNFGYAEIYENAAEQREFIRQSTLHYQNRPTPRPYANMNIEFRTPVGFGPEVGGGNPLANWRMAFIGSWRAGNKFDYEGFAQNLDVDNNVQWRDSWNLDLRLTKKFGTPAGDVQMFLEMDNALNIKSCCGAGFDGRFDWEHYMKSLHLPEETFEGVDEPYLFPYGDDQPGDYRDLDVDFVPIETVRALPDQGKTRMEGEYGPLYYEKDSQQYFIWENGSFQQAPQDKVDQVLEDKAYIDMPNFTSYVFLYPRNVWFGLRYSF
jgi:hypothetical protein